MCVVEEAVMGDGSARETIKLGAGMLIPLEAKGGCVVIAWHEAWDVVSDRIGSMAGEAAELPGKDLAVLVLGVNTLKVATALRTSQ